MKKGLVFGKFMPVHAGHIALIEFAASYCDALIVSMSYTPNDPISPDLRLSWLQALFGHRSTIEIVSEPDDFHDDSLPLEAATNLWAAFIRRRFPEVDGFICSEAYGEPLSRHSGLPVVYFDVARQRVPVSATLIRQHPFRYWDFIPAVVRPYFVKKVCLYGPESVGKTSMAQQLAEQYQTAFVPEVARAMLTSNEFTVDDIIRIGYAHTQALFGTMAVANKILFCDTDVITTAIYSDHYLHEIPPVLHKLEAQVTYDRYFLLDIDVPWVADGLRDLGHRRAEMFHRFKDALDQRGIAYTLVSGDWAQRMIIITTEIDQLLAK